MERADRIRNSQEKPVLQKRSHIGLRYLSCRCGGSGRSTSDSGLSHIRVRSSAGLLFDLVDCSLYFRTGWRVGTVARAGQGRGVYKICKTVPEPRTMGEMRMWEPRLPLQTEKQTHLALLMQYWG